MTKYTHVHRYEKAVLGKKRDYIVYRCNLPGCMHYLPKKLAKGKLSVCNRCENKFVLTPAALELQKPHCLDCTNRRNPVNLDIIKDFLEEIEK
jgi:hypothetical protein